MKFIYTILFLLFVLTLANVYHRRDLHHLFSTARTDVHSLLFGAAATFHDPFDSLHCPLHGVRCENRNCQCDQICTGPYQKYHIYEKDDVIVSNIRLKPGTYCLPSGLGTCNAQTSRAVYSVNGWHCIHKNSAIWKGNHLVACRSDLALDNALNVLYDHKRQAPASQNITNYYELLPTGHMRFGCQCGSRDRRGNPMVALDDVPFTCAPDYCLQHLTNNVAVPGWDPDAHACDCGGHPHMVPGDPTSPCAPRGSRVHKHTLQGVVHCETATSFHSMTFRCPQYTRIQDYVTFETPLGNHRDPKNFVN